MTKPKQCPSCGAEIETDLDLEGVCHECGEPIYGDDDRDDFEDDEDE